MNNSHYYCVIMAGGLGSRIWPVSRQARPKQFLEMAFSGVSFLKMAYRRVHGLVPEDNIIVVSLERYRELVFKELPTLPERNLLLEPFNRNTASCIAYATYAILKRDPQAVVLVTPADQVINDVDDFRRTILKGLDYASGHDELVTLGILPTRPDTNFGYIQADGPMMDDRPVRVKTFTEKPEKEIAQAFIDSGEFLWNAGIFIWKASVIASELQEQAPEVAAQWREWDKYISTPLEKEYLREIYPGMPRISIDYAVMEKSERVMAIPSFFDWADLGSWESLYEYFAVRDSKGNSSRTRGKFLSRDNSGTIVLSPHKGKLVAVKGLTDYMVLDLDDVLLICPRDEQSFKEFLSELSLPEYEEYR
ncbi:MAG: mannose-1-phosphate guanylyltransferase [Bacteroidales bacterium]|nr:mannose-1-phosphate guanylyltransferase [Bacteroidales bacterium]